MSSKNVDKFEDWYPFNKKNDSDTSDIIRTNHLEWIRKYPEMKMFKLSSDYYNNTWNWLYSINKKTDSINIDLFIEIEKMDKWSINFELIIECEDDYLINNISNKSMTQDEKHYEKQNLNFEELNYNLNRICEFIRKWNNNFYKEHNFHPLVD